MSMGLVGLLTTAAGTALAAAGYFYFDFSLWLIIPGGVIALVGLSLLSGAREQVLLLTRHRISDSYDQPNRTKNDRRSTKER